MPIWQKKEGGKWKISSLNKDIPELEEKGHEPSRAKLKIVQLEPWLKPARLGFITRGQGGSGNPEASKSLLFAQKSVTQNSNIVKPDR